MPKGRTESDIERKAIKKIQESIKCIMLKLYDRHLPDRLVLLPNGKVEFIEFKRPSRSRSGVSQLRIGQGLMGASLKELGYAIYVISNEIEIDQYIDQLRRKND